MNRATQCLGMNTPYPNNDSDDTNKLLEEIEVKDSFFMIRLQILKISGYLHDDLYLYLFQVIIMVIFIFIFNRLSSW